MYDENSTTNKETVTSDEIILQRNSNDQTSLGLSNSLSILGRSVKEALAPLAKKIWGYEDVADFLIEKTGEKLKNVEPSKIISPLPQIAGPAIENLRYVAHDEQLREMYANLLANAMNTDTANQTHPGYVDIIKNMSTEDALLINYYKDSVDFAAVDLVRINNVRAVRDVVKDFCSFDLMDGNEIFTSKLVDNLCRLGILYRNDSKNKMDENEYQILENAPFLYRIRSKGEKEGFSHRCDRKIIEFTDFGEDFKKVVLS